MVARGGLIVSENLHILHFRGQCRSPFSARIRVGRFCASGCGLCISILAKFPPAVLVLYVLAEKPNDASNRIRSRSRPSRRSRDSRRSHAQQGHGVHGSGEPKIWLGGSSARRSRRHRSSGGTGPRPLERSEKMRGGPER